MFKVNTDGTGFVVLHTFTPGSGNEPVITNTDGAFPVGKLALSGNTLYGTAKRGGNGGNGTLFKVHTDGTGFVTLRSFTAGAGLYYGDITNSDGAGTSGSMNLLNNTLYGNAQSGGSSAAGTIFRFFLPPRLTIIPSEEDILLTWPTNATGFTLQSSTNLGSLAVWSTNSPVPVVVNGQNTVTNPISGSQQFFRLSQ